MDLGRFRIAPDVLAAMSEKERRQALKQLQELEQAFKANPLLGYRPHPKQGLFHSPDADGGWPRSRLFLGGNRSGKSVATMVDTVIQLLDSDVVPDHLAAYKRWQPPIYVRVVTPDLTNTMEGVVLQKFREWCPVSQLKGGGFDKAWDKMQRMLRFKNGSWVQFFSNDQDLDKFGGAALHRVVYDEEPRADIRRECLMRLIDYGGEELFGLTPLHGMSWVYEEFFAPWQRGQLDQARLVLVDMDDNPYLNQETKDWVLSGLSAEERQARKQGRFVAFAGLIYPQFGRKHVIPQLPEVGESDETTVPMGAEVFCGIDPGIRHMCGVLFAYLTPADDMVVFDEITAKDMTIKDVCDEIRMRCLRWGCAPQWYTLDPSARNRATQTGRSDQQEFADNGIYTIPAQNSVTAGINRVRERLEAGKLQVTANCTELREEFNQYHWVKDTRRTEHEPRDTPVKKNDHLLDCLRYLVMQRPLAPTEPLTRPTDSLRDRLLRHSLRTLGQRSQAMPMHPSGPGVFTS